MSKASKLDPKLELEKAMARLRALQRYAVIVFVLVVVSIYGFMLLRITSLSNIEPTDDQINSQVKTATIPKIDEKVVLQLKSLRDNSVSVQSLFDEARTNPFQQ